METGHIHPSITHPSIIPFIHSSNQHDFCLPNVPGEMSLSMECPQQLAQLACFWQGLSLFQEMGIAGKAMPELGKLSSPLLGGLPPKEGTSPSAPRLQGRALVKFCEHNHKGPVHWPRARPPPKLADWAPLYNSAPSGSPGGFSTGSTTVPSGCGPRMQGRWAS